MSWTLTGHKPGDIIHTCTDDKMYVRVWVVQPDASLQEVVWSNKRHPRADETGIIEAVRG